MSNNLLSLMTFFPLVGMVIVLFLPKEADRLIKSVTLIVTIITFFISLPLAFDDVFKTSAAMQYTEFASWISIGDYFQMNYNVGVDGISLWLVLLTTFIMPIAILSTWHAIDKYTKGFMALALLLETAMLGAFISLDLFLFYIFWELMLVPMYFMIGIWGGKNRIYASVKFFMFTAVGSLLMLVAIIYVYYYSVQAGVPFENGFSVAHFAQLNIPATFRPGCFWLLLSVSPSRCRCSRSIPGCPMHIPKLQPPVP